MMDSDILAPVSYLAVEFPQGHVTNEGLAELQSLLAREIIALLDLEFIAKDPDGTVHKVRLEDIVDTSTVDVSQLRGTYSGLLDEDDVAAVASVMQPGRVTGLFVYENVWATNLLNTMDVGGARLIGSGSVDTEDLVSSLESD